MTEFKTRNGDVLQAYARASKQRVVKSIREAMGAIEREIEEADGVYPHGKLNQRELCERAGITQATLQKDTHKMTTLVEVNAWLERIAQAIRTSKSVRKVVNSKVELLNQRNKDLKQQYHETELKLIDANDEISKLKAQIAVLIANGRDGVTPISVAHDRRRDKR